MASAVCIAADDDMEKRRAEILESAKSCDTGDGVIVLTDMFGGTPSNLAISIMEQARIEVLAGVNLPMLVKVASVRNRSIAEAVRMAQEATQVHNRRILLLHSQSSQDDVAIRAQRRSLAPLLQISNLLVEAVIGVRATLSAVHLGAQVRRLRPYRGVAV